MAFIALNTMADGKVSTGEPDSVLIIVGSLQCLQLMLVVVVGAAALNLESIWGGQEDQLRLHATAPASSASRRASLVGAIALFFMSVLVFTGLYSLALLFDGSAFSHLVSPATLSTASLAFVGSAADAAAGVASPKSASMGVSVVFALVFFSVETQSLVGLGDVVPTNVPAELIALAQQVVGVCFSVFIIAQVLPVFGKDAETAAREEEDEARQKRMQQERRDAMRRFQRKQAQREARLRAEQLEASAATPAGRLAQGSPSLTPAGAIPDTAYGNAAELDSMQARQWAPSATPASKRGRVGGGGNEAPSRSPHACIQPPDLDAIAAAAEDMDLGDVEDEKMDGLFGDMALANGLRVARPVSAQDGSGPQRATSMRTPGTRQCEGSGSTAAGSRMLVGGVGQTGRHRFGTGVTASDTWESTGGGDESLDSGLDSDAGSESEWSESTRATGAGTDEDGQDCEDASAKLGPLDPGGAAAGLRGDSVSFSDPSSVTSQWSMDERRFHCDSGSKGAPLLQSSSPIALPRSKPHETTRWRVPSASSGETGGGTCASARLCWEAIAHDSTVTMLRRWARRRLVLLSVLIQLAIGAVLVADPKFEDVLEGRKGLTEISVLWGAVVLQVLQVCVIVSTSIKFVARAWSVTVLVLLQAYVALILAYSGIYLLLFFLGGNQEAFSIPQRALEDPNGGEEPVQSTSALLALAFEFVYFSFSVQTSVGFGDVAPQVWYARVACVSHILISLVFNSIVLGYGLAHIGQAARRREDAKNALIQGRSLIDDPNNDDPPRRAKHEPRGVSGAAAVVVPQSPKRLGVGVLRRPSARRLSTGGIRELAPEVLGGSAGVATLRAI